MPSPIHRNQAISHEQPTSVLDAWSRLGTVGQARLGEPAGRKFPSALVPAMRRDGSEGTGMTDISPDSLLSFCEDPRNNAPWVCGICDVCRARIQWGSDRRLLEKVTMDLMRGEGGHCYGYCGSLGWTFEKYGRITHKHDCPRRGANYCQTHPEKCDLELKRNW